MTVPGIDWDQMGDDAPETGFEDRQNEIADMAEELPDNPADYFPDEEVKIGCRYLRH